MMRPREFRLKKMIREMRKKLFTKKTPPRDLKRPTELCGHDLDITSPFFEENVPVVQKTERRAPTSEVVGATPTGHTMIIKESQMTDLNKTISDLETLRVLIKDLEEQSRGHPCGDDNLDLHFAENVLIDAPVFSEALKKAVEVLMRLKNV